MTDERCSRCGGWYDGGYQDHDFQHLEERKVEALERIAAALEQPAKDDEERRVSRLRRAATR